MEQIRDFGTANGAPVKEIALDNGRISCRVITLGAALRKLIVPDRDGRPLDVVLGYDTAQEYADSGEHFGATVGRVANRIACGRFSLDGKEYALPVNEGKHHLHGGPGGFTFRLWTVEEAADDRVTLSFTSPDGDQGYPGTLTARAVYALEGDALVLRHEAVCDAPTPCSMTNHSYFNLAGHASGAVNDQIMTLFARRYAPIAPDTLPLGTLEPVAGTPMDLTAPAPLGPRADADFAQLKQIGGFDHSYEVDGPAGTLRPAALAVCPASGVVMEAATTLPAVHLFTTNDLAPGTLGKGGAVYGPRQAFCLETQFFPNSPNVPAFPSVILRPGQKYAHETRFTFSAK